MSKCRNCVTVYNAGSEEIAAFTPVEIGRRMDGSGLSDDFCFEVTPAVQKSRIIGVTDAPIMPGMPGRAVISGIAAAKMPGFFDAGDLLAPDDYGNWQTAQSGQVTVISPAGSDGIGTVLISPVQAQVVSGAYEGDFCVRDVSRDEKLMVSAGGGTTDVSGSVDAAEFEIVSDCDITLVAQYIDDGSGAGHYECFLTNDVSGDERIKSGYFGEWLIASIYVREGKLKIVQQWQNGAVYFGTRYWVK